MKRPGDGSVKNFYTRAMSDKHVCLVTGANSGIGLEAAVELARRGFHVVLGCRDRARGEQALREVRTRSGGSAELLLLDLSSLASVRQAAAELSRRHPRLTVLLNNAGLICTTRSTTVDGFETAFGVNHLGHFLLTRLLLPSLQAAAPSRIVNVSSEAHRGARWDWEDVQLEKGFGRIRSYANSKLANIWFTRALARRLPAGVTTTAVHPGSIATNFFRNWPAPVRLGLRLFFPSPEVGARPLVRLAADEDAAAKSGVYFDKLRERLPSAAAQDDAAAERLWQLSETLAGA